MWYLYIAGTVYILGFLKLVQEYFNDQCDEIEFIQNILILIIMSGIWIISLPIMLMFYMKKLIKK